MPVLRVPLTASVPDHAPEAVHAAAPVEVQVSVVLPPLGTMLGSALIVTVGPLEAVDRAALTVTVADCVALPPAPVHVNIYLAVALRGPVECVPLGDTVPAQSPDAEQAVAFVELHDNVAD